MLLRLALFAGLLGPVHPAYATDAAKLCRGDALRLCLDEIPDRDRISACLQRRKAELSPGCQSMFAPTETMAPVRTAGH